MVVPKGTTVTAVGGCMGGKGREFEGKKHKYSSYRKGKGDGLRRGNKRPQKIRRGPSFIEPASSRENYLQKKEKRVDSEKKKVAVCFCKTEKQPGGGENATKAQAYVGPL